MSRCRKENDELMIYRQVGDLSLAAGKIRYHSETHSWLDALGKVMCNK